MDKDIRIKAGSPDNEIVLREIIKLFTAEYGQNFLAEDVYNMQFWARRIGTRFLSLLAFDHNHLIAHLALQAEKCNKRSVQLLYPATNPHYFEDLSVLSEMAWRVISTQASRHNWQSIFTLMSADDIKYQGLVGEYFNMQPTAVFPSFFNTPHDTVSKSHNAVFFQRFFESSLNADSPIFVPRKHRDICAEIYAKLGLKRKFNSKASKESFAMPTDIRALETFRYHVQDFSHVYITPSLLNDFSAAISYINNSSNLLFINTQDPLCPDFCEYIEEYGYSFSGVTPTIRGREAIVYSRLQEENLRDTATINQTSFLFQYISDELVTSSESVLVQNASKQSCVTM